MSSIFYRKLKGRPVFITTIYHQTSTRTARQNQEQQLAQADDPDDIVFQLAHTMEYCHCGRYLSTKAPPA
jgi:hypothetical protein